MITDKEYPATHSMSTAWYIVDEDGNVGIMDFDENGPVPWVAESETCTNNLVFGHEVDEYSFTPFDLTDEQLQELLGEPVKKGDVFFVGDTTAQVYPDKIEQFKEFCHENDIEIELCVSERLNIYNLYPNDFECEDLLLNCPFIKNLYKTPDFYVDSTWDAKTNLEIYKMEREGVSMPYYFYKQPYNTNMLAHKMITPKHPVNISQVPKGFQERIIKLPFRFKDVDQFQISEWCPCITYYTRDYIVVDGCQYERMIMTDNTEAYVLTGLAENMPTELCPLSSSNEQCYKRMYNNCQHIFSYCFTLKPTVFRIFNPASQIDYNERSTADSVMMNSLCMSYIPCAPVSYDELPGYNRPISPSTKQKLIDFFMLTHSHFEHKVKKFNPRVFIVDSESLEVIKLKYETGNHTLTINDVAYPLYLTTEVKEQYEEIKRLALMPYRGEDIPLKLSVEEVEQLKKKQ